MNFEVIRDYLPLYFKAFLLTIKIGWIGIALSLGIGVISAFILHFKIPVLSAIVKVYVELFRNTPLLVQLFFVYFVMKLYREVIKIAGYLGMGIM